MMEVNRNVWFVFCLMAIVIFSMVLVNADLGSYNQYSCIQLKTILKTDNVTLASINYPNGSVYYINELMTKNNLSFTYNFCRTNAIGKYIYDYYDAQENVYVNSFSIHGDTQKGLFSIDLTSTLGIIIFFIMLTLGFIMLYFGETNLYGSVIIIICGMFVLFSGVSLIFALILIIIGVLSIIYKT